MKIKNVFFGVVGLALLLVACQNQTSSIQGALTGVESDTLIVSQRIPGEKANKLDTIVINNGKFSINLPDSVLSFVNIMAKPKGNQAFRMPSNSNAIVLLPGNKLSVKGSIDSMTVTGSEFYKQKNEFKVIDKFENEANSIFKEYNTLKQEGKITDSITSLLNDRLTDVDNNIANAQIEYIKANPNNDLSAYFFGTGEFEVVDQTNSILSDAQKNGPFKPLIDQALKKYEREKARKEAEAKIQPGMTAPDFTLKDINGKEVSLSSLQGKYVVIDFWGTWCVWCVKGIPEMKKYYEKYNSKLQILGVDCGDTEETWKNGVKEHSLPWINVFAGEDDTVTNMYAISGFPTKAIIDPKGNIVKIVVGESPEFYSTLDELLK
ncbi:MAG: TlpA disulfide reductase family protein [Bacteroidales bacterium]|nr:TlpA disulfide reductase family protein [Bacteroidales bacterium]